MEQPLKVATPRNVVLVRPPVHVSVPAPGFAPSPSVTVVTAAVVMVLPPASWIATTGWIVNGTLIVDAPGWDVNPSFVAVPSAVLNGLLVVDVRTGDDVATSV